MEKVKQHKGIIIGIVIAIIIITIAVVSIVMFAGKSEKDSDDNKKSSENSTYESQINNFAKACTSEEDMENFVKEYVNLKAYYVMGECDDSEEFAKEYEKAQSEDYEDEDFIDEVLKTFNDYVEEYEITVTQVEKAKDVEEDDGLLGGILSDISGMKAVKFTVEADDEKASCYAYFYDDKIFMIIPDMNELSIPDDDIDYSDEMSELEVQAFNANFEAYQSSGQKGSSVKVLIDVIIDNNRTNEDNIVGVYAYLDNYDSVKLDDATRNKEADDIETELKKLRNEIEASKTYGIDFDKDVNDRITTIHIYENK